VRDHQRRVFLAPFMISNRRPSDRQINSKMTIHVMNNGEMSARARGFLKELLNPVLFIYA
jgi:hypothetical protein